MKLDKIDSGDEFYIKEIFTILKKHKLVIIITTIISISIALFIVHNQKPFYSAYSIVKVEQDGDNISTNLILDPNIKLKTNIDEDISFLKTFYINNKALNLNKKKFQVQYYKNIHYKSIEIYKEIPIDVTDIEIKNKKILGAKLRITPDKDGYYIDFVHSLTKRLRNTLFDKPLLKIKGKEPFRYNEKIENSFFTLRVNKLANFSKPIDIVLNGDNRYIYNNIIINNLDIIQTNENVPYIKIYYRDRVPTRAISYVKALTKSFIDDSLAENRKQNSMVLSFINNELKRIKKELKRSEKRLESYRISNKAIQPSLQASTFIKKLSNIDFLLSENQLKVYIINNLVDFIKRNQTFNSIAPSLIELNDKATLKLTQLLDEAQLNRDKLLMEFTSKHPRVKEIDGQIMIIKNKIISNITKLQKNILEKERNLEHRKKSYERKLTVLPIKERKIINIQRDYEVSSKLYNFLLEKQAENEILKVANMSKYKIIEKAYSNFAPTKSKSRMILGSSVFIGIIIGLLLITLKYLYSNKILIIKDIESRTDIPVYGSVTLLRDIKDSSFEKYNMLRTNLQLLDNKPKVILLSSINDINDKELITLNLAISFAKVEYKTIIIDLDKNNPLHYILVNSYSNITETLYPTKYENLDIISIQRNINKKEFISQKLPLLIKELKVRDYDYIIINTIPFGIFTDTRNIMKISDINLVIFKEGYSERASIANLNYIKEQNNINNLGIVFLKNS